MPDKVLVSFVQRFSPYNPGETAGFPVNEAQELVARGVAVLLAQDEEGNLVPTKAVLAVPGVVTAEQTAAGLFPPTQEATRAPTNNIDDALVPAGGSEGSKPDVAAKAQEEKGDQPELEPFIIPAVQAPSSAEAVPPVDGPPPVESGTPEEAEKAQATLEASQQPAEAILGGGEEPQAEGDEPKKRGRPRKSE